MENELYLSLPLLLMTGFSVLSVLLDAIWKSRSMNYYFTIVSFILTGAAAVNLLLIPPAALAVAAYYAPLTRGMITFGGYPAYFDVLFCITGLLTVIAARPYIRREYREYNEFTMLLLFSVYGMMIIVHAHNLLLLFVGIELMSIAFYVLAGYFRQSRQSVEASLKYLLLGAFATGFLLYGIAFIYGATSSIDLSVITASLTSGRYYKVYLFIGSGLIIAGLGFKSAVFPFHQWAPDVYQGSPTVVTGLMSTGGKAAAVVALAVVISALVPGEGGAAGQLSGHIDGQISTGLPLRLVIAIIAAATMLVGNITALVQMNIKRMLAYSSVAHAGYLLIGVASANIEGWHAIMFYSAAYTFMQLGAFAVISVFERNYEDNLALADWSGLYKSHPWMSAAMAIFMLSLAGMPPFAGFFGKYYLFAAAIKGDMLWLAVVGVVSSIISMYFYIGLILRMYFHDPIDTLKSTGTEASLTIAFCAAAVVVLGVFPSLITGVTMLFPALP